MLTSNNVTPEVDFLIHAYLWFIYIFAGLCFYGYVANIFKTISLAGREDVGSMMMVRLTGIFVPFIGVIMGFKRNPSRLEQ